jgi:DHA1 family bicyclomycin/chloramphenicol resistance-like MFS transporter
MRARLVTLFSSPDVHLFIMKQLLSKTLFLTTIILMDILAGAELDLFVPSFPELQTLFDLSPFWVEALLSINLIGFCLSLFFVGTLADRYGRKPIILIGICIFIMGTVLCLILPTYSFLLVGRFLQGVGIAAPATLCFLIIADAYPLKQQQFLMAMLNGVANASIAAAPILGSYISLYFHWTGNFLALLCFGLIVLFMTIWFIPAHVRPAVQVHEKLSLKNYLPLFQSRPLMLLVFHITCIAVTYWVFVGMSPILFMEDLGVSLKHFGFYQGSMALVFAGASIVSGLIIHRYDQKKMLHLSYPFCIVSLGVLAWVTLINSSNPILVTFAVIPFSICVALPVTILYPICLNLIPEAKGRISAILQGSRLIVTAVALQVAGYYYQHSFQNIGLIITASFFIAVITLFFVIKNKDLVQEQPT